MTIIVGASLALSSIAFGGIILIELKRYLKEL
jgi:hypothetical protein